MQVFGTRAAGVLIAVLLATGLAGIPASGSAQSTGVHARAPQATLKANVARIDSGKRLVLTGKVRNRPAGTKVSLQRIFIGINVWETVATVRVGKAGAVRYVDRPTRAGERRYRLVVPKAGARARFISAPAAVTVWNWRDLNEVPFSTRLGTWQRQTAYFNGGDQYVDPVIIGDPHFPSGYMSWGLSGLCDRAVAIIQATDGGLNVGTAQFEVDGVVVDEGEVEGSSTRAFGVNEDLTGANTITFAWQVPADQPPEIAMYDARVHCTR